MNWRSRWIIPVFVVAGLVVGVGPAYAGQLELPPVYWSAPLALAGLAGAAAIGARRSPVDTTPRRLRSAAGWAVAWALLVSLPWALREGLIRAELAALHVPSDAVPIAPGVLRQEDGFIIRWRTEVDRDVVARRYDERLRSRGWRLDWAGDYRGPSAVALPPGSPAPRWSVYRRLDGLMLVMLGPGPAGEPTVGARYIHLDQRSLDGLKPHFTPPARAGGGAAVPK